MKHYSIKVLFLSAILIILLPVASHSSSGAPHIDGSKLSLLWSIPFIGILLSIAIFPLVIPRIWHHHYGKISLFWGLLFISLLTVNYGLNVSIYYALEVYLLEFLPFITLLLALFAVSGGIYLKGSLTGTPLLNTGMLLLGLFSQAGWEQQVPL